MNKIYIFNLLVIVLFMGCQESNNYMITMKMPNTMPPLFQVQEGLNLAINNESVVFEKYVQTRIGTAAATKLYSNGDLYKIYLDASQSLADDNIVWEKQGTISQSDINNIKKIASNSVVDFINKGPYEQVTDATEDVNWYFYFDTPVFVQTQIRPWQWQWWKKPKFVGKMNEILD